MLSVEDKQIIHNLTIQARTKLDAIDADTDNPGDKVASTAGLIAYLAFGDTIYGQNAALMGLGGGII